MDYHSAINKNGTVTFADRWLELENIKFSELRSTWINIVCSFSSLDPSSKYLDVLSKSGFLLG